MKNAKFFLSAIAVLAIVGGALAFKAQKVYSTVWYPGTNNFCTLSSTSYTFVAGVSTIAYDTQEEVNAPCQLTGSYEVIPN